MRESKKKTSGGNKEIFIPAANSGTVQFTVSVLSINSTNESRELTNMELGSSLTCEKNKLDLGVHRPTNSTNGPKHAHTSKPQDEAAYPIDIEHSRTGVSRQHLHENQPSQQAQPNSNQIASKCEVNGRAKIELTYPDGAYPLY